MAALFPSPQAIIPNYNPAPLGYSVPVARRNQIDPPRIITLAGTTLVFDARLDTNPDVPNPRVYHDLKVVTKLVIQNLSADAMYVGINQDATAADGTYHIYLPANSQGAQLDLSIDQPEWVTVFGTDGDKVSVYIAYPKDSQPV